MLSRPGLIRTLIVFAALWGAVGIAAGLVPRAGSVAPVPSAAAGLDPPPKADRLPILPFRERFAMPVPEPVEAQNLSPAADPQKMPARSVKPVKETRRDRRDVCQRHGMRKHYTHRGRWPSWRCR